MPIVKVIEVIASSEIGFDDAIKNCLTEVSKTVHNIDSIYVKDFKVHRLSVLHAKFALSIRRSAV